MDVDWVGHRWRLSFNACARVRAPRNSKTAWANDLPHVFGHAAGIEVKVWSFGVFPAGETKAAEEPNPAVGLLVALAGPITNLVVACVLWMPFAIMALRGGPISFGEPLAILGGVQLAYGLRSMIWGSDASEVRKYLKICHEIEGEIAAKDG